MAARGVPPERVQDGARPDRRRAGGDRAPDGDHPPERPGQAHPGERVPRRSWTSRPARRASGATRSERLLEAITILWQTDAMRAERPRVIDEVRRILFFFDHVLVDAAGAVHEELERLLAEAYPAVTPPRALLGFGSWAGGDQDGNPNCTPELIGQALDRHRETALRRLRDRVRALAAELAISERMVGVSDALLALDRAGRGRHAGRGRRHRRAQPRRAVPAQALVRLAAARAGGARTPTRGPSAMLDDLALVEALAGGAPRRADRAAEPRAAAAAGGALRLPHGAPRRAPALVAAARRGRRAGRRRRTRWRPPERGGARDVPRAAGGDRPPRPAGGRGGDRELHPRAGRPAGAAGAGRARRGWCATTRSDIDLVPLFETIEDLRARAGHPPRAAGRPRVPAQRGAARGPADRDGRLLRLEQGRRLPGGQPGAVPGAGADRRRLPPPRGGADAVPRPRGHGEPRRRVDLRGGHGRPGRDPRTGGSASPSRARRCRTSTACGPIAERNLDSVLAAVLERTLEEDEGGGFSERKPRVGRGGRRRWPRRRWRRTGGSSTRTRTSCPTSSRPARSASSGC